MIIIVLLMISGIFGVTADHSGKRKEALEMAKIGFCQKQADGIYLPCDKLNKENDTKQGGVKVPEFIPPKSLQ